MAKKLPYVEIPDPPGLSLNNANRYFMLRTGIVTRVDPERWLMDVQWLDGPGGTSSIYITNALHTPRAFVGGMPEENSLVLCHFSRYSDKSASAHPIAYLPTGYKLGLNYDAAPPELGRAAVRRKMRKLYPGEVLMQSRQGSELFLDENAYLSNSYLNEIELRAVDQSINMSSLNNYVMTDGVRVSSGLIVRNDVVKQANLGVSFPQVTPSMDNVMNLPGNIDIINGVKCIVGSNGKRLFYPTTNTSALTLDQGGVPWVEHRIEVLENGAGVLPILEQNADLDVDNYYAAKISGSTGPLSDNLIVVSVLGTLIGNNPLITKIGEIDGLMYGKVLYRQIFLTHADTQPTTAYLPAVVGQEATVTSLYHLSFPKTDKLGQAWPVPPPIGSTSRKSVTTFDINKEGKLLFNISASSTADTLGEGRSIEGNIDGGTKLTMGKNSLFQESLTLDTTGKIKATIGEDAPGSSTSQLEESINITTKGGVSLTIQKPDRTGSSLKITITRGDVTLVNQGLGDVKVQATTGNIELTTQTGNVNIKTTQGNINAETTQGNVVIKAATTPGKIQLQGAGVPFPLGGVVTTNHVCAYTGAKHPQGSLEVEASG